MKVKICGVKTVQDGKVIEEAGADFIGFIFASSKRQISIQQAKKITQHLKNIKTVGVFVNPTESEIRKAVTEVPLDYVQLHGDETEEFAEKFQGQVIKAFPSNSQLSYDSQFNFPAEYTLVDSPRKQTYGGSGEVFDWKQLDNPTIKKDQLILAGGLNSENITEAVQTVQPFAVDISSGVESNGKKDPEKIKKFMETVRSIK